MQPTPVPPPPPYPPPPALRPASNPARVAVGLLLVAPAALALLIGYLIPTVRTAYWSLQERAPFEDGQSEFVGFDNYDRVLGDAVGPIAFSLLLAVVPLLALLVVAPPLALLAHLGGRPARLIVRLGLAVPTVCFAPTAFAISWLLGRYEPDASARVTVWLAVGFSMIGVVCGVGVTAFLGVLRGRAPGRPVWPAGLTVAGLGLLAVLALSLQIFTFPYLITRGGPERQTVTPMLAAVDFGLQRFELGPGAAVATLVLIPVMLLGLAAGVLVLASRLRIEQHEPSAAAEPRRAGAIVGAGLGLLVVLAITLYGLWPWLARLAQLDVAGAETEAAGAIVDTWLPPIVSTVIGVGLAAVAGFGIGALRPLGRASELLLLPFAPWLFIGVGPLFLVKFMAARDGDRLDTFLGAIPPIWVAVPALFVFTLLFRGLASRPARLGPVVLRALPMVALVGAATWLVQSQSLLWGLLTSLGEQRTVQVLVLQMAGEFATTPDAIPLGLVLPIPAIALFGIGLGLFHLFYLDRLVIRAGPIRQTGPGDQ